MTMPNDHTAIADRLEACLVRASANMTVAAIDKGLLREAAQALTASADEVERAQKVQDALVAKFESLLKNAADNYETALARTLQAEADLASARKALELSNNDRQLVDQAREKADRVWTGQGWLAEQSLDNPGYWEVWTLDATGQRRIILARRLRKRAEKAS